MEKPNIPIPFPVRVVMTSAWFFRHWLVIWLVLFTIYNILPIIAPILMQANLGSIAQVIYDLYSLVGHQLANRSFFFFGEQVTYTIDDLPLTLIGDFLPDSTTLAAFIGNKTLGWKMAWSDRLVSMYGSALITSYFFTVLHKRENFKTMNIGWMLLLTLPLIIDGTSHWISDLDSLIAGFRWDNAWFATLTANIFPETFYVGDHWGSFNSILRLVTGVMFGIGLMAWGLAQCKVYFERNAAILEARLENWWVRQLSEPSSEME